MTTQEAINALITEFKRFRKENTMTCNSIRHDEVAQFVIYKQKQLFRKLTHTVGNRENKP